MELDGFKFIYIDHSGKIYDLRPKENIPSYNNFISKSEKEIYSLLITAYKKQISELDVEKYCEEDEELLSLLKKELKEIQANFDKLNR